MPWRGRLSAALTETSPAPPPPPPPHLPHPPTLFLRPGCRGGARKRLQLR